MPQQAREGADTVFTRFPRYLGVAENRGGSRKRLTKDHDGQDRSHQESGPRRDVTGEPTARLCGDNRGQERGHISQGAQPSGHYSSLAYYRHQGLRCGAYDLEGRTGQQDSTHQPGISDRTPDKPKP
jgi:hypothetical protein